MQEKSNPPHRMTIKIYDKPEGYPIHNIFSKIEMKRGNVKVFYINGSLEPEFFVDNFIGKSFKFTPETMKKDHKLEYFKKIL